MALSLILHFEKGKQHSGLIEKNQGEERMMDREKMADEAVQLFKQHMH